MAIDLWKNILLKKNKKNIAGSILSKTGYLLGAAIILAVHYFSEVREYPYDAGAYWYEGEVYGLAKFSLYNYSSPLRGYLYPLFIYVIRKVAFVGVGTERKVFCVAISFLYAFFFIVLIPKIAELMFDIVVPMWSRIIYVTICSVMFRGLIVYPLTDIFGIMLVCFAIYFFLILTQDRVMSKWGQALCAALMGIALGGAYYVRPIYLISWAVLGLISIIYIIKSKKWILFSMILGMLVISTPQICINQKHFNTYSPMIQTQEYYGGQSLYLNQLKWGISVQKYETNMDVSAENVPTGMIFADSVGTALLEKDGEIDSYFSYILFCIRHFADMTCNYLKHIFNGLDIVYPSAYIYKVYYNRFIIQLINYTLILMGLEGVTLFIKKKHWNWLKVGVAIAYGLPILLVIPTAVETRFFLGVHLVLYLMAVTVLANANWKYMVWKNKWKKLVVYVSFLAICFLLNSQTFNCYGIPLW